MRMLMEAEIDRLKKENEKLADILKWAREHGYED